MSVWWSWIGQMLLKWANKQPRVKPGELDQTNGDCSTIVHRLNTQCPSGYIMGIHDIIAMRLYCYSLALLLLSNNTILMRYHNMVHNIPTPFTPEHSIYKFPPVFRFSACASPCLEFTSHCIASQSHSPYLLCHAWRQFLTPRSHPQNPIGFMLRSPAPSILAAF